MSGSRVDHIPVISVGREGAPLALWLPPLGMTKDDMRPVLESLAGAGFHAVSLAPWQHGDRGAESADEIRARVFTGFRRHMWPIIGQTTLDCLRVIDHFGGGTVVAGGTSMGGDAAVALAGLDRRVTRVAQWFFDRLDPLTHVESYAHGPSILFECGADDRHVPADGARRFAAPLGGNVRVNVRAVVGHIDGASSPELLESCIAWLRGLALWLSPRPKH